MPSPAPSAAPSISPGMSASTNSRLLWRTTPSSLVPDEDQGYYIGAVFLPDGASLQRTDEVVSRVIEQAMSNPANEYAVAFTGMDFLGGGFRNNAATIFVTQIPWDQRTVTAAQLVGAGGELALRSVVRVVVPRRPVGCSTMWNCAV